MPVHIDSEDGGPTAPIPVLAVEGLTKSFGAVRALSGVSLTLRDREIRAVCGENGAGKSTFVKLLMGLVQPDSGIIRLRGQPTHIRDPAHAQSLGLGLVAQELSLAPHLSILDNIWLGYPETPIFHRRRRLREKAKEALATLGVADWSLDDLVGRLTIGQKQIVEIARLIAREAKLLVLDEPTATLSDPEIERMMSALRALRENGRAILYISHRLGDVFELCDSVSVFRNGQHVLTRETTGLRRAELIHAVLGRPLSEMYPPPPPRNDSPPAIKVERLTVGKLVRDLSFTARRGEILCIAGQIGSGANHVTRALAGLAPEAQGVLRLDGRLAPLRSAAKSIERNILFISDDRAGEGLFYTLTVFDNVIATSLRQHSLAGFFLRWRRLRRRAHRNAERVALDVNRLDASAMALSGGNQQKVLFSRILRDGEPGLLILSEPTRGIDVGARAELYRLMRELCAQGYALIMYSSDIEEVVGMADAVITLYRGQLVGRYARNDIEIARILADITHPDPVAA